MPETAISFAEEGIAAKINYNIPLPGSHTGRRVIALGLDMEESDYSLAAFEAGESIEERVGASEQNGEITVDKQKSISFLNANLTASGLLSPADSFTNANPLPETPEPPNPNPTPPPDPDPFDRLRDRFLDNLERGVVEMVTTDWAGRPTTEEIPLEIEPQPQLFIVERYGISSFLGDYGMGRTVRTFTLLPGESTTISLKTWKSTKQSVNESSSIIDSHENASREQFNDKVQAESTDKSTRSKTKKWHVEAEVKAGWGWGSAKVSGGASGEYQSAREEFSKNVSESVKEHAAEASTKRELSVTSSSERTEETGSETLIERTISNVNMRRTLNFVFRELNQKYITKFHLKDIRIGFTNGRLNSWREVPLSGLRELLLEYVVPGKVDEMAQNILKVCGIVFDKNDTPVTVIEKISLNAAGTDITVSDAVIGADNEFAPPDRHNYYRFRRAPLAQDQDINKVDGVVMSEMDIVMRTDSVLVEALLGQADALDNYAMEIQEAAARKETLSNDRETLIQATINAINDPEERAKTVATIYGPPPPSNGSS